MADALAHARASDTFAISKQPLAASNPVEYDTGHRSFDASNPPTPFAPSSAPQYRANGCMQFAPSLMYWRVAGERIKPEIISRTVIAKLRYRFSEEFKM